MSWELGFWNLRFEMAETEIEEAETEMEEADMN